MTAKISGDSIQGVSGIIFRGFRFRLRIGDSPVVADAHGCGQSGKRGCRRSQIDQNVYDGGGDHAEQPAHLSSRFRWIGEGW
jgi:hypothetical protein